MLILQLLLIIYFFVENDSFILKSNKKRFTYVTKTQISDFTYSWDYTSKFLKDKARSWFIKRATDIGIDWEGYIEKYSNEESFDKIKLHKFMLENKTITYPEYYVKPFHGYDEGNLNWDAALEGEGATISMSVNYWKNNNPKISESWLRNNFTNNIINYKNNNNFKNILDIGCSVGISTEHLKNNLKNEKLYGLDLSPYFIALATYRSNMKRKGISFFHNNAEEMAFEDNSFDLITVQFMFHEMPLKATNNVFKEIKRVLKPGGTCAIIDLDSERLLTSLNGNYFRKWAFEVTEPHVFEYYNTNLVNIMKNQGFKNIFKTNNDPMNSVWLGTN